MSKISDYKKQHPEYANIPNVKLAEILYEKAYKGRMDETDFYKFAFPEVAAERAEDVYTDFVFPDDEFGGDFDSTTPFKPTTSDIAKQAGVSVNDPASSKARFGASLGYNQEQKMLAVKDTLSKSFKQDIDVRMGPNTGEMEYYNPKTKEYALVDAPGFDRGDFLYGDMGGDAMVILPDLAATVVGTVYSGGNIPAGIAAGGLAAGVGEFIRLKMGQSYGANLDLTDEQLFYEGLKTAGISVGAGTLGVGAAKLIKGAINIMKGRTLGSTAVKTTVEATQNVKVLEANEIATNLNKQLEDAGIESRLKYTLGEALDDKDLLAIQHSFETKRSLGRTGAFTEASEKQMGSLNEYFKLLKQNFGDSTGSTYDTGKIISEVIEKRQNASIKGLIKKQEASENLLTKTVFKLPDGSSKVTGVEFRSIIGDLSKAYKSNVKLAAAELDEVSGVKLIDTDKIAKAINNLSEKEKRSLVEVAKVEGVFKPGVYDNLLSKNSKMMLSDARETMSVLGQKIREKEIGLAAGETPDVGRLMFLKSAFTDQIKKNAGKEYLNELQRFNDLVITNKELLNNDIIAKLTKNEIGNILKVGDEAIFETTFKKGINNAKEAKQVYDVVSRSPEAFNAYKNSIFNKYKTDVLDPITNKPNLVKHNAFIKNYENPLKIFFNKTEFNKISRLGGLQRNIEKTNKIITNTQKELNKSFEGTLLNTSPAEIFNKIYKPGNIGQIKELKRILIKDPTAYKKFQRDVLTDLNEKVMGPPSSNISLNRVLDAKKFDEYLYGGGERGRKAVLRELFGDEYVKNLDLLNKALQIASRTAPPAQQGVVGTALTDLIRARLGQFTLAGRLFTAGRRIFTGASNRVIARALLNPDSLKDLMALRHMKTGSKAAAAILAKLGGSVFILPDEGTPIPPKSDLIEQDTEVGSVQQLGGLFNRKAPKPDNTAQLQTPPLDTVGVNPASFDNKIMAQNATGLTQSEQAFLDDEEKAMRLNQRGMTT